MKAQSKMVLFSLAAIVVMTTAQSLFAQQPASPPPVTTMSIPQEGAAVRLLNQTPYSITYEALGDTQPRTLSTGDDVLLAGLNTPATLTFFYTEIPKDRQTGEGLLEASLQVDETTGALDVVLSPTVTLDLDVSNLTIEPNGNVFVF